MIYQYYVSLLKLGNQDHDRKLGSLLETIIKIYKCTTPNLESYKLSMKLDPEMYTLQILSISRAKQPHVWLQHA